MPLFTAPDTRRASAPVRTDWSRLLEVIVHGGMVVGMVSFIGLDLVALGQGGPLWMVVVGAGLLSAVVVVMARGTPLVGLMVVVAISLAVSMGSLLMRFFGLELLSVGFGEVAAISIMASEVARRLPAGQVVAGLTAAVIATALNAALRGPGNLGFIPLFWLVLTLAVVMGLALRWTERQRQLSADVAGREERLRIARELHDNVAHHVTGIVIQAQAARAVGRSNPDAVEDALARIEESGMATMTGMRRLVGALRSDDADEPLSPGSGLADIENLVDQGGFDFEVHKSIDTEGVPPPFGPSIYRIVQESLTNVRRHGIDVSEVSVTVRPEDDGVQISVVDDGRHHDRPGAQGFGLSGMSERVAALGGHFWAGARPGEGWAVTAWIPIGS